MVSSDSSARDVRRRWVAWGAIGLLGVLTAVLGLVTTLGGDTSEAEACLKDAEHFLILCGRSVPTLSDYGAWLLVAVLGLLLLGGSVGVLRATNRAPG